MIVLAIIATIASVIWTLFVFFANSMSDSPGGAFQGGWSIGAAWLVTIILWATWAIG